MERIRCPNPKCGRHILDIEKMPPGETVLTFPAIHLKTVKGSDTYILEGVLRFTINVDCSTPIVFSTADKMQPFREGGNNLRK